MLDYYSILGVSRNATQDEILWAYDERMTDFLVFTPTDELQERRLEKAFEILNDPEKRSEYDAIYSSVAVPEVTERGEQATTQSYISQKNPAKEWLTSKNVFTVLVGAVLLGRGLYAANFVARDVLPQKPASKESGALEATPDVDEALYTVTLESESRSLLSEAVKQRAKNAERTR